MDRLNLSSMRTTDEDGIIDAMIAMEALLSDGTQEMTTKFRCAWLDLQNRWSPSCRKVFMEMKRIYAFRSKIVHGDATDKHREITRGEQKSPLLMWRSSTCELLSRTYQASFFSRSNQDR